MPQLGKRVTLSLSIAKMYRTVHRNAARHARILQSSGGQGVAVKEMRQRTSDSSYKHKTMMLWMQRVATPVIVTAASGRPKVAFLEGTVKVLLRVTLWH